MTTVSSSQVAQLTPKETPVRSKGPLQRSFQSLIRNRSAIIGFIIIGLLLLIAVFAPLLATHDPRHQLYNDPGYSGRLPGRAPCVYPYLRAGCTLPGIENMADGQITVELADDVLTLNAGQARIVEPDVRALANLLHITDGVLTGSEGDGLSRMQSFGSMGLVVQLPPVNDRDDLSILRAAIEASDFGGILASAQPFTLLAPTNAAFEAYFAANELTLETFLADPDAVSALLAEHVLTGRQDAEALRESADVAPPPTNLLGLDRNARDFYSRLVWGSQLSLSVGVTSVSFAIVVGTLIGLFAGYFGGWFDDLFMRFMDVLLAFPSLLLAIAIVTILGPGLQNALLAIAIVTIPQYARLVRASVLSVKEQEFITAERALGAGPFRIVFNHVLPNSLTPIIVQGTLGIGTAILDAAALSFLGLGAQPPTPEWGAMLSESRDVIFTLPRLVFFPGLMIALTVLGFNLLGDGMRDAFDPRLSKS